MLFWSTKTEIVVADVKISSAHSKIGSISENIKLNSFCDKPNPYIYFQHVLLEESLCRLDFLMWKPEIRVLCYLEQAYTNWNWLNI